MKVLIVTKYAGSFPFVEELIVNLKIRKIDSLVLDMVDMYTIDVLNNSRQKHISNKLISHLFYLPKIGTLLKIIFYKFYLRRFYGQFEHIDIHFASSFYNFFIKSFKKISKSNSVVIWGSDFYRISQKEKTKLFYLFQKLDKIIITNPQMREDFLVDYPVFEKKTEIIGFGIGKLDDLKYLSQNISKTDIKARLSVPDDRIILTCGYNGIPQQQHSLIIDAIELLTKEQKQNLFLIFPFTYGAQAEYLNMIKRKLSELGIPNLVLEKYMSQEELCYLRIVTDITINAQTTDALSASLQEHLMCKNILLAGDWLPYRFFADIGIEFFTFNHKNLPEVLSFCINNFERLKEDVHNNSEIIYNLSSWGSRIERWVKLYKSEL